MLEGLHHIVGFDIIHAPFCIQVEDGIIILLGAFSGNIHIVANVGPGPEGRMDHITGGFLCPQDGSVLSRCLPRDTPDDVDPESHTL
jgi:hypothetical protein